MDKVKIGSVAQFCRGVSYKKEQAKKTNADNFIAILRANNIESNRLNFDDLVYVPSVLVQENQYINSGDIIITMSSGSKSHVGKVAIAQRELGCSFGAFCGKLVPKCIAPKYLYYILQNDSFRKHIENQCRGTNINNIRKSYILDYEIDLPSIAEQERIVSCIEELFSQLDASVNELKTAKERLKVYRQAVLKEAFSTVSKKVRIRDISEFVTSGSRGWAKYYADKGARFIRITDLTRDKIQLKNDNIQYVDLPNLVEGKRSRLNKGDALVSITADLGSIGYIADEIGEAYVNQHIAMIRFKNPAQGEYMAWYLKSDFGQKDLLKNKRGGGKLGLGLDDIRDTSVPVIDNITASNTVNLINQQLSICDYIEQTIDTCLQQVEALRQSILKKAFEGEI